MPLPPPSASEIAALGLARGAAAQLPDAGPVMHTLIEPGVTAAPYTEPTVYDLESDPTVPFDWDVSGITDADNPTRTAAVQRADDEPTQQILTRKISKSGASDPKYLSNYMLWQDYLRKYARTKGVVAFAAGIVADSCARCRLTIEERGDDGEWHETKDPRFRGIFDLYRNSRQDTTELIRDQAWHYELAGEMLQITRDGRFGVEWYIYSTGAVIVNRDVVTVRDIPNGSVRDGTAWQVPKKQVNRFWIMDQEWRGLATSPLAATVDDLHLYHSLYRYARNTADSAVAMNGILWTPNSAHKRSAANSASAGTEPDAEKKAGSAVERAYLDAASRRFTDEDSINAMIPPMFHWEGEVAQWVKIGEGLDQQTIEHRREALEAFARGANLPASLVVGGGPGDGNHWTEWLVDKRFFTISIAPIMDRITHNDLTQTFLYPILEFHAEPDMRRFRVGYDPAAVIVNGDQSDIALKLHTIGLLGDEATLEAANFSLDQAMRPDEIARLLRILNAKQAAQTGLPAGPGGPLPAGPGNVTEAPPALPPGPPVAPPAAQAAPQPIVVVVPQQAQLPFTAAPPSAGASNGHGPPRARERVAAANRVLARVTRARRDAGRELMGAARLAFAQAVKAAGVKVAGRAKGRGKSAAVQAQVATAIGEGRALLPHLAAVGITEAELVQGQFDTLGVEARKALRRAVTEQAAALRAEGFAVPDGGLAADLTLDASDFMAHVLESLLLDRLTEGNPLAPPAGEVTGDVPASLARQALDIALGDAQVTPASSITEAPMVFPSGAPSLAEHLAGQMRDELDGGEAEVELEWVWGFYGDPAKPFEPHEQLSGLVTSDPEGDERLANGEGWPDGDLFQPGDHDGCSCDWVPTIGARYPHPTDQADDVSRELPGLGADQAQVDAALRAVNR